MIDLETIVQCEDDDKLKEIKIFLFQENLRLSAEAETGVGEEGTQKPPGILYEGQSQFKG